MPPPQLVAFLALLAAMFGVAFAAGRLAGPVAPGMHRTIPATAPSGQRDMGDMNMQGGHR
jgi:hypothetical protein